MSGFNDGRLSTSEIRWMAEEYDKLQESTGKPQIAGSIEDFHSSQVMEQASRQKERELLEASSPEAPELKIRAYESPEDIANTLLACGMPEEIWVEDGNGSYVLVEHRSTDGGEECQPVLHRASERAVHNGVAWKMPAADIEHNDSYLALQPYGKFLWLGLTAFGIVYLIVFAIVLPWLPSLSLQIWSFVSLVPVVGGCMGGAAAIPRYRSYTDLPDLKQRKVRKKAEAVSKQTPPVDPTEDQPIHQFNNYSQER